MGRSGVLLAAVVLVAMISGCAAKLGPIDKAPVAKMTAQVLKAPLRLALDASGSSDPEGKPLSYHWNWLLGQSQTTEAQVEVPLPADLATANATLPVSLVVTDPFGGSASATTTVALGSKPSPGAPLAFETWPRWVKPGTGIFFDAQRTKDADGVGLTFEWLWGPRGAVDPVRPSADHGGACASIAPVAGTAFDTGCLMRSKAVDLMFADVGTYDFKCSVHPWMRGRVTVNATAPADGATTVEVAGFAFQPRNLTVAPGAKVTFLDRDPVEHEAVAQDWTPAIRNGGGGSQLTLRPAEGDYVVRLVVENAKGDRASRSWGVRVAADAPMNPQEKAWTSASDDGGRRLGPNEQWTRGWFNLSWSGHMQAALNYTDVGRGFSSFPTAGNLTFGSVEGGTFKPVANCPSSYFAPGTGVPPRFLINCDVVPGHYAFHVNSGSGSDPAVLLDWKVFASATLATYPAFGDLPVQAVLGFPQG